MAALPDRHFDKGSEIFYLLFYNRTTTITNQQVYSFDCFKRCTFKNFQALLTVKINYSLNPWITQVIASWSAIFPVFVHSRSTIQRTPLNVISYVGTNDVITSVISSDALSRKRVRWHHLGQRDEPIVAEVAVVSHLSTQLQLFTSANLIASHFPSFPQLTTSKVANGQTTKSNRRWSVSYLSFWLVHTIEWPIPCINVLLR